MLRWLQSVKNQDVREAVFDATPAVVGGGGGLQCVSVQAGRIHPQLEESPFPAVEERQLPRLQPKPRRPRLLCLQERRKGCFRSFLLLPPKIVLFVNNPG